ncbi:MAG: pyridoxal-phosphate dependent enzyme [Chloroflexota bacterium]
MTASDGPTRGLPTTAQIQATRADIDPVFLATPVLRHPGLDEALGCRVTLKLETLNPIRSFKGRGTEALLATLPADTPGVIATSTGNFGQGLTRAAVRRGIASTIVVPAGTSPLKLAAMRRLGATVHEVTSAEGNGKAVARRMAAASGLLLIEDGLHPEIDAGAGTIAQELTESAIEPEVLLVQVGDGALAGGVGAWMRERSPSTRLVGLVATRAPSLARSMDARRDVEAPSATIAEGMAVSHPVPGAVARLREALDEVVLVSDEDMLRAMGVLAEAAGVIAEPAGAAGVAAILADPTRFAGRDVVSIVTGSNVDRPLLARALAG